MDGLGGRLLPQLWDCMQGGGHREPHFFTLAEASSTSKVQVLKSLSCPWLFCPSFRVGEAASNEGPVAVLVLRVEEGPSALFVPQLVLFLVFSSWVGPTARARTPLLS